MGVPKLETCLKENGRLSYIFCFRCQEEIHPKPRFARSLAPIKSTSTPATMKPGDLPDVEDDDEDSNRVVKVWNVRKRRKEEKDVEEEDSNRV